MLFYLNFMAFSFQSRRRNEPHFARLPLGSAIQMMNHELRGAQKDLRSLWRLRSGAGAQ
jgi:hypothetical protein